MIGGRAGGAEELAIRRASGSPGSATSSRVGSTHHMSKQREKELLSSRDNDTIGAARDP